MNTLPLSGYPKVIEDFLPRFEPFLNKPQLSHLAEYLTGLMICPNKTVSGINDAFIGHKDQSAKNHFLTEANWSVEEIDVQRLKLIKEHISEQHIKDGYLILDDSLAHKTGQHIDGVGWHYDHSLGKVVLGHQLVTTHYYCSKFHLPLHFEQYDKDSGFTKHQIARELIDQAVKTGLPFSTVIIDSWYFNKENTSHIEKYNKHWVAACKSNRCIIFNGKRVRLDEFIKSIPASAFRLITLKDGSKYWIYYKTVSMCHQGRVRIVATQKEADLSDEVKFFVTSGKDWPPEKILNIYCCRWAIETFYRDAKQNLGLEDCELRIGNGIKRHFCLVFLAYTLLQLSSLNRGLYKWLQANIKTIGGKCHLVAVEILRSFIMFIIKATSQRKSVDEVLEICFRPSAQLRFTFA
ncbi:MAG: IS701 family transposase [Candidatus Edwardsbacteria bacterium]